MKSKIKITVRRTCAGHAYVIKSIDGKAEVWLQYPPPGCDRNRKYHAGDVITQEEANAIAMEYEFTALAPKE